LPLGKIAISIMLHRAGHLGVEVPVRFRFDGREIEIVEIFDHWYGPDYCYFKRRQSVHFALLRGSRGVGADDVPKTRTPHLHPVRASFNALTETWSLVSQIPKYFPHLILIFILIFECEHNAAANITLRLGQVKRQSAWRAPALNGFLVEQRALTGSGQQRRNRCVRSASHRVL
jgi:hypothetical protein